MREKKGTIWNIFFSKTCRFKAHIFSFVASWISSPTTPGTRGGWSNCSTVRDSPSWLWTELFRSQVVQVTSFPRLASYWSFYNFAWTVTWSKLYLNFSATRKFLRFSIYWKKRVVWQKFLLYFAGMTLLHKSSQVRSLSCTLYVHRIFCIYIQMRLLISRDLKIKTFAFFYLFS